MIPYFSSFFSLLPHSMHDEEDVCLISKDPPKKVKEVLQKENITTINKVNLYFVKWRDVGNNLHQRRAQPKLARKRPEQGLEYV